MFLILIKMVYWITENIPSNHTVNISRKITSQQQQSITQHWESQVVGKGRDMLSDVSWWMRLTNIRLELQGATFMNVACPEVFYTLQYNSAEQIQVTHDMMWYDMGVTRTYSYIFDLHQFYCSTFLLLLSLMSVSVTPPVPQRYNFNFWKDT